MINKHKKLISLLLVIATLCSLSVSVFATTDYTTGTDVTYNPADPDGIPNSGDEVDLEAYTITVPAALKPNQSGTVTLHGTWASDRVVTVTSDASVELTNSIDANNKKTLTVTFAGISKAGNNTEAQTFTETVAVGEITNALFGTWSGKFNYNVEIANIPMLEGGGQTFYTLTPSELSFRSTAPLGEFEEVLVNGEPIDPSNYTLKEGSTIVTLKTDYLQTLSEAGYEITVVSKSGSPSADFDVVEQTINDQFFYYDVPYMFVDDDGNILFNNDLGGFLGIMMQEDGTLYAVGVDGQLDPAVIKYQYTVEGNIMTCTNGMSGTISEDGKSVYVEGLGKFAMSTQVALSEGEYFYMYGEFFIEFFEGPFTLDKTKESYAMPLYNLNGRVLPFNRTFQGCENLKQMEIPFGAEKIGRYCFWDCTNLKKVILPNTLTSIDESAFRNCISLTTIEYKGTVEQWNAIQKTYSSWHKDIPATEVVCSDGIVTLK